MIGSVIRRAKKLEVLKYHFFEYTVLDRKVRGSSILVETNLFLAIELQTDLIIRTIL